MFASFQSTFKIPDLRKRIIFTALMLVVYRLGGHITLPGVNRLAIEAFFTQGQGGALALFDLFAGGNLSKATIFALGIMPYISASIILQLLQAVIPYFEKLAKEGEEGRKKISQYTRYGTVLLAAMQSFGVAVFLQSLQGGVMMESVLGFKLLTMLTLTAGTIFVMWLGEQITERGIGNGISLIITVGIIARYPLDLYNTVMALKNKQLSYIGGIVLLVMMVLIIAGIIFMTQGQRRIPVQYPKRVVGRRVYGGQNTHIPLKVNTAGVIPIIFAQAIVMFPATIASLFPGHATMDVITRVLSPGTPVYVILYSLIIIFFAFFYTAIVLNPIQMAENMKKFGGFIPGIRPGKNTANFIERSLSRITLPGAVFLAFIAVLPDILMRQFGVPFYFGGTGLLIVVGVVLDTLQQIESHLFMRHYDGFMKKGKLRGRR
ncbi:MAG: preprotein translocase subunit SecY [bacterium]|nr:preprotein translocase subunit SecY [bacterium]